jgi:ATP-dependent RNA helicase TDRD9
VERESINFVSLDEDPRNEATRLLVASSISLNPTGDTMVLRKTTLMPKLAGLTSICCLLFSPTVEVRCDETGAFTGAICGIGFDPLTKRSIHPDNDIELDFDVKIDEKDFQMINTVRMTINLIIGSQEKVDGWFSIGERLKTMQSLARENLTKVIDRERVIVEPKSTRRPYKWNQIPSEVLYQPMLAESRNGDDCLSEKDNYYSCHKIPNYKAKK